ncbi:MAG TPA: zinc-finger domain-containing protein [Burkholderiaceae bacterium]|nr:zinc-finger domain-containing protein [Burkholderiaceae bacterium]
MSDASRPVSGTQPAAVELEAADLPAFCPNRKMPVWNHHPRVYLDVVHTGQALCPYCSTEYRLKPGTVVRGH